MSISEPKADFGPARQDLAAGFAGALPGPRLTSSSTRAPHTRALTELGKHTHTHTHRARKAHTKERQHSHHTQRGRPIGIVVVPFVCGVNVGDLLCGTSIASIQSIESIKSIESIESVESSDSIESIESIQSIEPIESIEL